MALDLKCDSSTAIEDAAFRHSCVWFAVDTVGGTANGARCYFPYIYQGKKWYQCLTANNDGVLWCATTPNYDLDQLWGNCVTPKSNSKYYPHK